MERGIDHTLRLAAAEMGRKGARARVANSTPAQRTAWARKAGRARQRTRRAAERQKIARRKSLSER